jgi:hypothetical protein
VKRRWERGAGGEVEGVQAPGQEVVVVVVEQSRAGGVATLPAAPTHPHKVEVGVGVVRPTQAEAAAAAARPSWAGRAAGGRREREKGLR